MKVINFVLLVVGVIFFAACGGSSSSDTVETEGEEVRTTVRFDLGELTGLNNKSSKKSKSLDEAVSVILSITTSDASTSTVYSDKEVKVVKFGSNFVTEPIALNVDTFLLTKFLVLDANGVTIFATPLEGSDRARLVTNALPILFQSTKDQVETISPEVLDSDGFEPGDFGYGSFSLDLIETFAFQLTVFNEVDEQFAVTDAQLTINTNSVNLFNGSLDAATNSIELRTGLNSFELIISKTGYVDYTKSFTESELVEFSSTPLLVYLNEEQSQPPAITNKKIGSGWQHTVSLKDDGTVWSWGFNNYGQLGDGTTANGNSPTRILNSDGSAFVEVVSVDSVGYHSLALKSDGTVWTWGRNNHGQLGDGSTTDRNSPVQVLNFDGSALTDVVLIVAGGHHSVVLKSDGTIWSWGYNEFGQLGDGTTTNRSSPVQMLNSDGSAFVGVTAIVAGVNHSIVLKNNDTVWSLGRNDYGQLGDGSTTDRNSPVQVLNFDGSALVDVASVVAGGYHLIIQKNDGTIWSWGYNNHGELGDGTTTNRSSPVQVLNSNGSVLVDVASVVAGGYHSIIQKNDGTVWSWGYNNHGEIGDGTRTNRSSPVQVMNSDGSAFVDVEFMFAGGYHSTILKTDGLVWSWGRNDFGQLGDGTITRRLYPVNVLLSDGSAFKLW